jgi:hypothetical protein
MSDPTTTPAADLAAQIARLEQHLKEHEDMSNLRHGVLLEQIASLETMIAALPSTFRGTVDLPFVGQVPIALGPMRT